MHDHAPPRPRLFAFAAALIAATATAADEEPPYFSVEFPAWVEHVTAGADGTVYAVGVTNQSDLPGALAPPVPVNSWFRAFVSAWAPDGRLLWTVYMPFATADASPMTRGIAASEDGAVWMAFCAQGVGPYQDDVCVVRIDRNGSIVVAERIGGSDHDRPAGLVVTADGDAIVVGTTFSHDFPTMDSSSWSGGVSAVFAARVRADGSGLAWSRILENPGEVRCTAVAPDGSGGVCAALAVSSAPGYEGYYDGDDLVVPYRLTGLGITRVAADGTTVETTPLPHGYGGGVRSIAPDSDGSMLVAGMISNASYESDAFVMRVLPGTGEVTARWQEPCAWQGRGAQVAVEASGEVLLGTELFHVYGGGYVSYGPRENVSRIRRLTADLREKETLFGRDGQRSILDFVVAEDDAVCLIGHGLGVPFHPDGPPMTPYSSFVARVPSVGALPPQAVSLLGFDGRHVHLAWRGGDPAERYVIEKSISPQFQSYRTYEPLGEAPRHARDAWVRVPPDRWNGTAAGSLKRYRVVAVFPSGVRMAGPEVVVPVRPWRLRATWTPLGVRVEWRTISPPGDEHLELERRLEDGPWQALGASFEHRRHTRRQRFTDPQSSIRGMTVEYRLRTVTNDDRGFSAWTYSGELRVAGD